MEKYNLSIIKVILLGKIKTDLGKLIDGYSIEENDIEKKHDVILVRYWQEDEKGNKWPSAYGILKKEYNKLLSDQREVKLESILC